MATLRFALTSEQLGRNFQRAGGDDAYENADNAEMRARFGAPRMPGRTGAAPYPFLEEDPFSPNAILRYHDLGRKPHYTDQLGRQYFCYGHGMDRRVYVRIPESITRVENKAGMSMLERLDFPRTGDQLQLARGVATGQRKREREEDADYLAFDTEELIDVTVLGMVFQRTATAVIDLDTDIPLPEGFRDLSEADQERLDKLVERRAKKYREEGWAPRASVTELRDSELMPPPPPGMYRKAPRDGRSIAPRSVPSANSRRSRR